MQSFVRNRCALISPSEVGNFPKLAQAVGGLKLACSGIRDKILTYYVIYFDDDDVSIDILGAKTDKIRATAGIEVLPTGGILIHRICYLEGIPPSSISIAIREMLVCILKLAKSDIILEMTIADTNWMGISEIAIGLNFGYPVVHLEDNSSKRTLIILTYNGHPVDSQGTVNAIKNVMTHLVKMSNDCEVKFHLTKEFVGMFYHKIIKSGRGYSGTLEVQDNYKVCVPLKTLTLDGDEAPKTHALIRWSSHVRTQENKGAMSVPTPLEFASCMNSVRTGAIVNFVFTATAIFYISLSETMIKAIYLSETEPEIKNCLGHVYQSIQTSFSEVYRYCITQPFSVDILKQFHSYVNNFTSKNLNEDIRKCLSNVTGTRTFNIFSLDIKEWTEFSDKKVYPLVFNNCDQKSYTGQVLDGNSLLVGKADTPIKVAEMQDKPTSAKKLAKIPLPKIEEKIVPAEEMKLTSVPILGPDSPKTQKSQQFRPSSGKQQKALQKNAAALAQNPQNLQHIKISALPVNSNKLNVSKNPTIQPRPLIKVDLKDIELLKSKIEKPKSSVFKNNAFSTLQRDIGKIYIDCVADVASLKPYKAIIKQKVEQVYGPDEKIQDAHIGAYVNQHKWSSWEDLADFMRLLDNNVLHNQYKDTSDMVISFGYNDIWNAYEIIGSQKYAILKMKNSAGIKYTTIESYINDKNMTLLDFVAKYAPNKPKASIQKIEVSQQPANQQAGFFAGIAGFFK